MADVETWGWRIIAGLVWAGVIAGVVVGLLILASCVVGFFALWAMLVG